MSGLVLRHWLTLHGLVIVLGLVVYVTVARAFPQRRDPSAAIAWVVALALVPYLALPLYIMVGSRKLLLRDPPVLGSARQPAPAALIDDTGHWARRLAFAMGLADAATYEHVGIHLDGNAALLALREVIASAKRRLDVCTFILATDPLGEEVAWLLEQRAREGVRVRLLVDGVGALLGGRIDLASLRRAGVNVVKFVPPFRAILRGRANLRNHRKMVVADGQRLWCGGRNFAAEYFEGDAAQPDAWHDLSFDLIGTVAIEASRQFGRDWAYATRVAADEDLGLLAPIVEVFEPVELPAVEAATAPAMAHPAHDDAVALNDRIEVAMGAAVASMPDDRPPRLAQFVPSGPDQADDTVQLMLVSGCFTARHRILAVTPYFVPDATLLQALALAARRGVAVDVVLPFRSNHRMADIARNRPLRELVSAGARVWLVPHMVHAKAVVIDDSFALAGSANLDARSLFLNYEMMVAFYEPADVRRFAAWIDRERESAQVYVVETPGLARDLAEGLLLWLAFQL